MTFIVSVLYFIYCTLFLPGPPYQVNNSRKEFSVSCLNLLLLLFEVPSEEFFAPFLLFPLCDDEIFFNYFVELGKFKIVVAHQSTYISMLNRRYYHYSYSGNIIDLSSMEIKKKKLKQL